MSRPAVCCLLRQRPLRVLLSLSACRACCWHHDDQPPAQSPVCCAAIAPGGTHGRVVRAERCLSLAWQPTSSSLNPSPSCSGSSNSSGGSSQAVTKPAQAPARLAQWLGIKRQQTVHAIRNGHLPPNQARLYISEKGAHVHAHSSKATNLKGTCLNICRQWLIGVA